MSGDATLDPKPARQREQMRRALVLAAVLAACALIYGVLLARLDLSHAPAEAEFGAPAAEAHIRLYLQPIDIDPVNASLQMRISVVPDPASAATIAERDLVLKIRRGEQIEHVRVASGQALPEVSFDFDLESGNIADYPLDRYISTMTLAASEPAPEGGETPLPIRVKAWEGLLGFNVKTEAIETPRPGEVELRFDVSRTAAHAFFGIAIYAAMIVLATCALVIGSLVYIGVRRIEVTLAGALGAVIFALPALRGALPGAPPLGVAGDVLVFFWAEFAAIIALCLFVTAWARRGARP